MPVKTLKRKNFGLTRMYTVLCLSETFGNRPGEENKWSMKEKGHLGLIQTSEEMEKIFSPDEKFWTGEKTKKQCWLGCVTHRLFLQAHFPVTD